MASTEKPTPQLPVVVQTSTQTPSEVQTPVAIVTSHEPPLAVSQSSARIPAEIPKPARKPPPSKKQQPTKKKTGKEKKNDIPDNELFAVRDVAKPSFQSLQSYRGETGAPKKKSGTFRPMRTASVAVQDLQTLPIAGPSIDFSSDDESEISEEDPDDDVYVKKFSENKQNHEAVAVVTFQGNENQSNELAAIKDVLVGAGTHSDIQQINTEKSPLPHEPQQTEPETERLLAEGDVTEEDDMELEAMIEDAIAEDAPMSPILPVFSSAPTNSSSRASSFLLPARLLSLPSNTSELNDRNQSHVYIVCERKTTPDVRSPPVAHVDRFIDREQANSLARSRMQRYKDEHNDILPASTESYCASQLYDGRIWLDGQKQTTGMHVWVKRSAQSSNKLAELGDLDAAKLLPRRAYLIRQTITKRTTADDGEQYLEKETTMLPGCIYTNPILANNEACGYAIKKLKPKTPHMDYVTVYNHKLCPRLHERCSKANDSCDEKRNPNEHDQHTKSGIFAFELDFEDHETGVNWMSPLTSLAIAVEEFEFRGPLN